MIEIITEWLLIIYMEIATFILVTILSLILLRMIKKLPLSSLYIPWLLVSFGLFLLTIGVVKQEGCIGVAGLTLCLFWIKKLKHIEEFKEIEAIIREYIEELGELWFQECITVLRDHLKRIRGDNDEHLKDD